MPESWYGTGGLWGGGVRRGLSHPSGGSKVGGEAAACPPCFGLRGAPRPRQRVRANRGSSRVGVPGGAQPSLRGHGGF